MRLGDVSTTDLALRDELEALVEAHQAEIWWYLRFLGAAPALADDLTQETFLSVLRHPFEQRDPRSTAAYLRRTARNHFVSHCRRNRRELEIRDIQKSEVVWATFSPSDARLDLLQGCLSRLGAKARRAVDLRYRDGARRDAIARDLGATEEGIKKLLQRALAALADCMERKL